MMAEPRGVNLVEMMVIVQHTEALRRRCIASHLENGNRDGVRDGLAG